MVGVVSAPALGRRWWAAAGSGAWGTSPGGETRRLRVSEVSRLEDASFSYSSPGGWRDRRSAFDALVGIGVAQPGLRRLLEPHARGGGRRRPRRGAGARAVGRGRAHPGRGRGRRPGHGRRRRAGDRGHRSPHDQRRAARRRRPRAPATAPEITIRDQASPRASVARHHGSHDGGLAAARPAPPQGPRGSLRSRPRGRCCFARAPRSSPSPARPRPTSIIQSPGESGPSQAGDSHTFYAIAVRAGLRAASRSTFAIQDDRATVDTDERLLRARRA